MSFEVGDIVRVVRKAQVPGGLSWTEHMDGFIGMTAVITNPAGDGYAYTQLQIVDEPSPTGNWGMGDSSLELEWDHDRIKSATRFKEEHHI